MKSQPLTFLVSTIVEHLFPEGERARDERISLQAPEEPGRKVMKPAEVKEEQSEDLTHIGLHCVQTASVS